MLFLKGNKQDGEPQAIYLLDRDVETMMYQSVDRRLRDHGYPIHDRDELLKDMNFLRSKRELVEQVIKQLITLVVRSTLVATGAIILLGLKEYLGL